MLGVHHLGGEYWGEQMAQSYFESAKAAFANPHSWGHVVIPIPQTSTVWAICIVPFAIVGLMYFGWRAWRAARQKPRDVTIHDFPDADWNLVQIGVSAARDAVTSNAQQGSRYNVVATSGWRFVPVRLEVRKIGANEARMSPRLARKLGIQDKVAISATQPIGIHIPYLRPDLWTLWHPDPNIRLQWRLGTLFMALGIVVPHLLNRYFAI
jgi:hypothetical protein